MTDTINLTEIECLKLKLANAEFLLARERYERLLREANASKNKVIEEICSDKLPEGHELDFYIFDLEKRTMSLKKKEPEQKSET